MKKGIHILLLAVLLPLVSCTRDGVELDLGVGPFGEETRRVMLLYEAGFSNLGDDMADNIESLKEGYLPGKGRNDNVLLVFSHIPSVFGKYTVETSPVMIRLYQENGQACADTLKVWPAETAVANAAMVTEVFNWVRESFPAAGYGAVLSSHASGWLPVYYLSDPDYYKDSRTNNAWTSSPRRSFGLEFYASGTKTQEIELHELAAAIPYHLDYILFDACYMACIEAAWALRDVCTYLVGSPCEIPAEGFHYPTLAERLLKPETPDVTGVCEDYYEAQLGGLYGSAATVVDCTALDGLASGCRVLFDRYRSGIQSLTGKNVQYYDNASTHSFYAFFDLKDMLREAGASDEDLASLQAALDEAVIYEKHTASFLYTPLTRCCGLSVYLPAYPDYRKDLYHGTKFLDGFYQENVAWNEATLLVQ